MFVLLNECLVLFNQIIRNYCAEGNHWLLPAVIKISRADDMAWRFLARDSLSSLLNGFLCSLNEADSIAAIIQAVHCSKSSSYFSSGLLTATFDIAINMHLIRNRAPGIDLNRWNQTCWFEDTMWCMLGNMSLRKIVFYIISFLQKFIAHSWRDGKDSKTNSLDRWWSILALSLGCISISANF